MSKLFNSVLIIVFIGNISCAQQKEIEFPNLAGPYFGQQLPGILPQLFAPGIVTTDLDEGCSGWGNDMEYFIFQRRIDGEQKLFISNRVDDIWSEPELLTGLNDYTPGDFTIAPDGLTMVFASRKIIDEIGTPSNGGNVWWTKKDKSGWSTPQPFGKVINTKYHDSYPSMAANGNLYFFSRKPGGYGASDLYVSEFVEGVYQEAINIGSSLNTEDHEWDTYIASDESYMIYCSMMPGGLGEDDLYVSRKNQDGEWETPIHLGDKINSDKSENRPYISPDGKYFFFASTKRGNRDIYWVDAKVIYDLIQKGKQQGDK